MMKFGLSTDIVYWHEKLVEVHKRIAEETGRKPCTKVFVTFEKEASQRQCLEDMTTGKGASQRASQRVPGAEKQSVDGWMDRWIDRSSLSVCPSIKSHHSTRSWIDCHELALPRPGLRVPPPMSVGPAPIRCANML